MIKNNFQKKDSIWVNPFKIDKNNTREDILLKYKKHIKQKINNKKINIEDLKMLKDKILGCWCKPEQCHGIY